MKENSIKDIIEEKYTRYLNCETDIIELTLEEAKFILETGERRNYVTSILQEAGKVLLSNYKRVLKENEELKILKSGIQTLQNLGIEDGKYIVMSKTDFLNGSCKHLLDDYIPVQKVKDILNEINKEYIKQEEIFNKYFEKENRDMEAYYIQKEATGIMQELSWVEGKLQELLEGKGE